MNSKLQIIKFIEMDLKQYARDYKSVVAMRRIFHETAAELEKSGKYSYSALKECDSVFRARSHRITSGGLNALKNKFERDLSHYARPSYRSHRSYFGTPNELPIEEIRYRVNTVSSIQNAMIEHENKHSCIAAVTMQLQRTAMDLKRSGFCQDACREVFEELSNGIMESMALEDSLSSERAALDVAHHLWMAYTYNWTIGIFDSMREKINAGFRFVSSRPRWDRYVRLLGPLNEEKGFRESGEP